MFEGSGRAGQQQSDARACEGAMNDGSLTSAVVSEPEAKTESSCKVCEECNRDLSVWTCYQCR